MNHDHNSNVITENKVHHLCLCTGYDGIGRGLKRVFPSLRTVGYVEIEAFAIANLASKIEEGKMDEAPIFTDVKAFPYRKFRGCVDILSAGFPCQPFSVAGKKQGVEDPRHIYPFIANGITLCKPAYVLLENVEGIVSRKTADGESVLLYVLRDLESRGYSCAWGTFSAAEIGAPHLRKRIFILAKLGNSEGARLKSGNLGSWETQSRGAGSWVMENSDIKRLEGGYPHRKQNKEGGDCQATLHNFAGTSKYPARPNEEQFEWEEPRVISDSKNVGCGRGEDRNFENKRWVQESSQVEQPNLRSETERCSGDGRASKVQVKSKLGRTTDGSACKLDSALNRVDRLRLLGNGVVPDTCELAFRTLWKELN